MYYEHKPEEDEDQDQEWMPPLLCKPQYFFVMSSPLNKAVNTKAHRNWLGSRGVGESIGKPVHHPDPLCS
jgi:hypothetical protein